MSVSALSALLGHHASGRVSMKHVQAAGLHVFGQVRAAFYQLDLQLSYIRTVLHQGG